MGAKYTNQAVSGYNSSPPPDDGSVQASNKVRWSFIKTKITDPVLTLAQAINTALLTFTNFGSRAVSSTDSITTSDHMKTIEASGTFTESIPDATATGAGFVTSVKNVGTGIITLALVTATDTLDGTVNGTYVLAPNECVEIKSNAGATGYYLKSTQPGRYTFTPSVGGTATYTIQRGQYSKSGNRVDFAAHLVINSIGTGSASLISGLPFASVNDDNLGCVTVGYFTGLAVNAIYLTGFVNQNASTIQLQGLAAAASALATLNVLGNGASVYMTGHYYISQ